MTLEFKVAGQHIAWINNTERVVADSRNYLKAKFTLSEEWTYPATVLFKGGCKVVPVLLAQAGEEITVPPEGLKGPVMLVSCYCGDLITSDSARVKINPSGYTEDTSPPVPPPPNLYQELLNRVDTAQISAEANAEKTAADREAVAALSQTVMADITQTVGNAEAAVEAKAEEAKSSVESAVSEARESIQTSAQSAKVDIVQTAQASVQSASDEIASAAESAKSAAVQSITSVGETAKQAVVSEKNTAVKAVQDTSAAEQQTIQSTVSETIDQNLAWEEIAAMTLEENVNEIVVSDINEKNRNVSFLILLRISNTIPYDEEPVGHKSGNVFIKAKNIGNNANASIKQTVEFINSGVDIYAELRGVNGKFEFYSNWTNDYGRIGSVMHTFTGARYAMSGVESISIYVQRMDGTTAEIKAGAILKMYRRYV